MEIIYEVEKDMSVAEAADRVKEALAAVQFGVLWELNFKEKLAEKGLDFDRDFLVMEVCNPKKAKTVLDTTIRAGYFLPCKVAVYEKDGKAVVGMARPTVLIRALEVEALVSLAAEVEADLRQAIDSI
ncbi:DUF302 domain-containing protein [Anaerotalea alkaliphila]|uniref:DUF302 domain-containing protein n=1 Tax=Anaerotalea alkaliphila TaxID=2662126 RepID=A0A7X5KLS4_9FIRM|nr:DUF302 domain-containing protein [Anaerotalea alkaliphila]NDL66209.1 DUF302 domain-containing protein [Anaerotalea alkaliphila]